MQIKSWLQDSYEKAKTRSYQHILKRNVLRFLRTFEKTWEKVHMSHVKEVSRYEWIKKLIAGEYLV